MGISKNTVIGFVILVFIIGGYFIWSSNQSSLALPDEKDTLAINTTPLLTPKDKPVESNLPTVSLTPVSSSKIEPVKSNPPIITPIPSIVKTAVKKCEFPAKIGNYNKQAINDMPIDFNNSDTPKGIKSIKMISYDGWNINYFFVFDNTNNAKKYNPFVERKISDYKACEIGGIIGFCNYSQVQFYQDREGKNTSGQLFWVENNIVKLLTNGNYDVSMESVEAGEKRAREKLTLFATQFKDCKVE